MAIDDLQPGNENVMPPIPGQLGAVFPPDDPDGSKARASLDAALHGEQRRERDLARVIVAVDPGNTETAIVVYYPGENTILFHGKLLNKDAVEKLREIKRCFSGKLELAIEMIASYGMPVGRSVFDTCIWIGRFIEVWQTEFRLIVRKDVKMHICNSVKATDANIRQALMDRYGSTKEASIGTIKKQGPLYGFGNDERAALALAFTAAETTKKYTLGELKED